MVILQKPTLSSRQNYGQGFDMLLPSGWSMPFWINMVYQGARAGGLREERNIRMEASRFSFPRNHPDTLAGQISMQNIEKEKIDQYKKYPPDKRRNYDKLGVHNQFANPWNDLVKEWQRNIVKIFSSYLSKKAVTKDFLNSIRSYLQKDGFDEHNVNKNLFSLIKCDYEKHVANEAHLLESQPVKLNVETAIKIEEYSTTDSDGSSRNILGMLLMCNPKDQRVSILKEYRINRETELLQLVSIILFVLLHETKDLFAPNNTTCSVSQTNLSKNVSEGQPAQSDKSDRTGNDKDQSSTPVVAAEHFHASELFFVLRDHSLLDDLNSMLNGDLSCEKFCHLFKLASQYSDSLIPVKITSLKKGCPAEHSLICVPSAKDVAELTQAVENEILTEEYNEPVEPLHKGLLKHFPFIHKSFDIMRYNCLFTGSNTRWVIGYVSSAQFANSEGKCCGIGYVSLMGFIYFLLSLTNSKLLLFRNIDCLQYRFCEVEVLRSL